MPRQSRYTQDEQRTEFTLWAISRSPLIFGGNLTKLDEFTRSLMTNKEVLDLNQNAVESGPARMPTNDGQHPWRAWYRTYKRTCRKDLHCGIQRRRQGWAMGCALD